jgi:hypothetical protein
MSNYVCTAYQDSIFEVGERSEVGVLKDTPLSEYFNRFYLFYQNAYGCVSLLKDKIFNIFNIFNYHIITLSHHFMSEITLHTAQLPKSYFAKNGKNLRGRGQ